MTILTPSDEDHDPKAKPVQNPCCAIAGDHVSVVIDGRQCFALLMEVIRQAQQQLQLCFYIFADDDHGRMVRDALVDACARGVRVALMVDGFGSQDEPDWFFQPLIDAGAFFERFLPRFGMRYLIRNHQKMVIADRRIALLGGFNIESPYFIETVDGRHWCDLMARVEGPVVARLAAYYDGLADWLRHGAGRMRLLRRILRDYSEGQEGQRFIWLFSGPFARMSPLTLAIRRGILWAKRMDVVAAYFAPNPGLIRRLGRLAQRGRLRLITAGRSDSLTTVRAARHTYARLLRQGASIMEYQPSQLHMKLLVIDDAVYLGSANFDIRSLYINVELMLKVDDADFAAQMRGLMDRLAAESRPITAETLSRTVGWWRHLIWRLAYYLVVTLDPLVTRRIMRRLVRMEALLEAKWRQFK